MSNERIEGQDPMKTRGAEERDVEGHVRSFEPQKTRDGEGVRSFDPQKKGGADELSEGSEVEGHRFSLESTETAKKGRKVSDAAEPGMKHKKA